MQAFWVALDESGDMQGEWSDYQSATEMGPERICYECDHEFTDEDA